MSAEDEAAHLLEVLMRSPLADAVHGKVTLVAVTPPSGRGRYQETEIEVLAEAVGIEPRTVRMAVVFDTKRLPAVGAVVPARISVSHHDALDVDWDALAR